MKLNKIISSVLPTTFLSICVASFSLQSFADTYSGTPYKTNTVPGTVEAEDYDLGGSGVAYNYSDVSNGDKRSYRSDATALNGGNDGIVLGFTTSGDWTKYTITVAKDGDYSCGVVCSAGSDNGSFVLYLNDKVACRLQKVPNKGWDIYQTLTVNSLHLTAGTHVFEWYTYGGMNVDKFIFTRTGDISGDGTVGDFNYKYPITMTYDENPLFVNMPSQMYGSSFTGNLYTADPSAHVWNINGKDVLYLYASHDMEPTKGCDRMDRYHIFSTEDLKTWTDWGEVLNADDVKAQTGVGSNGFMWAPDAAYNSNDGLYYFYFPHKIKSTADGDSEDLWEIFVATSKDPAKNFTVKGYIDGVPSTIDPCVFVDDDGQPYIYTSGAGKGCWGGKLLKSDWTKLDGAMTPQTGTVNFHEAPWVFKKDGKYYLTHSDNHSDDLGGNQLVYCISETPLGPWTYMGVYMHPHGEDTAHGSIVKFNNQWYQFYHTANYSGTGALRSVCVDKVSFTDEGKIKMVHNWGTAKDGVIPEASLSRELKIEAENYNDGGRHVAWYKRPNTNSFIFGDYQNKDMEVETTGTATYLHHIIRNEWVRYTFNVSEDGRYAITCHVRQNNSTNSKFHLGIDGEWLKGAEIPVSSGNNEWGDTEIMNVELSKGEHFMELRGANGDIDVDYIKIGKSVTSVPGTIEAEDFDDGCYNFKNATSGNDKSYRKDQGVALSVSNGVIHVSNTAGGDWIQYTFNAAPGVYTVSCYVASPSSGKFYVDFDNATQPSGTIDAPTGEWQTYKNYDITGINLSEGTHTMVFHVVTDLNIDRFVFTKTGPLTGVSTLIATKHESDKYYNLNGMVVPKPTKGIYIYKGKKIIR
jgi:beta-xylosidase